MSASPNYFATLAAINVNDHVEKKGRFSYLSWHFAVSQLRMSDPAATWEVRRFEGLPYLACDAGVFVEVAVTVQGITLSQLHPVLDGQNRPILAPTAFDINTSIQRCLVKAIALHGLGLYIYAGEDLPQVQSEAANDGAGWRQLPWPVDDNYLGRFDAIAGQVLEAGYCEPIELQRRLTFCPARRSRTTKCRSTNNTASSSTRSLLRPRLA
jgi:hypothetical protein